jgi:2-phosphosulfolactate phosphatase
MKPKIHVLLKKEELDAQRLPGKIVVVLDVLFATSSIVTALAHGAVEVVPTLNGEAARVEARGRPPGSCVLSGELNGLTLDGFKHPTPLALLSEDLAHRTVVYSTTNGTVALRKAAEADHVYAGALLNGAALVDHLERVCGDQTVLIVCSGSADNFNLEDFYGAGQLVSLLEHRGRPRELSDAACAARMLYQGGDALACLSEGRVGRMMSERGLGREVVFAAQQNRFSVVPELRHGVLRPA